MSYSQYEDVYSPETSQQQMVVARQQFSNEVALFRQNMQQQQNAIDNEKRVVEDSKRRVQEQEASNWRRTEVIRAQEANIDNQTAVIKRDQESLARREQQIQLLEDQRRRNRTVSVVYIEDSFAMLSPRAVVENLTNSSSKIRKHAMDNISACIGFLGFGKTVSPTFVHFTPQDIAPYLLPKLHQLVSSSMKPVDSVIRFAEESVSAPPMAKAMALAGQCSRLAEYLIETNEFVSRLAICCLRQMVRMETSVVKAAYEAMALVIPQIPIQESPEQPLHPSIDFVKEVAPKIIEDCFSNGLWLAVAPLVGHHITSIRQIVLRKVVLLARQSDRNQDGIVEAHILGILGPYYQLASPPPDVVDFFVELLPLVTEKLCRRPMSILWLLKRLNDPSPKINATVIDAFRKCTANDDPTVYQMFVKAELLRKLDEPPIQQSPAITNLICQLLPVLAIPYAHMKAVEGIIQYLDHSDPTVATACLSACVKIVKSTLEDRTHLYTVVSKLNLAKESTLKLYDHSMLAFCKDWASACDYGMIAQHLQHSEQRIRTPAQQVWHDLVCNSTTARSKIVHDNLLDVVFELCGSEYNDVVILGATCCLYMAVEITKAGVIPTKKLVTLLSHPNLLLRQAALRGVQAASESSDGNCKVLLEAEAFKALQTFFETYPKDLPDNAQKILTRLAPFLRTSSEACAGLLQLLECSLLTVQHAARDTLSTISNTNLGNRETLRAVVLNRLELPTESLIEFAVKAIQDWIGPDLAQLNDFPTFFSLVEHSDRRIQTAALISLKQRLSNTEYQESLEKANIIFMLRSLSNSDNPEALNFVTVALRVLALSLGRNGHASNIINFLVHKEPKVREGAAAALEAISNGSARDRKFLLEEDVIERLVGHDDPLEETQIHLLASIIPMLSLDYLESGKADLVFKLVDHSQQQVRSATNKSLVAIASGTMEQKAYLRDALLPRLDQASPLLREVAANCLSRSLANDLVNDGDFIRIFRIFHNEDARVREPLIAQLQTYIQGSDETARRRLVDARILPTILQAYTPAKDDLLDFMSGCLLPMLGPSFTQDDGGASLFPLLTHDEHRIRVSTVQALRNAIDLRFGNLENMAKAFIVGTLHPLTTADDLVCDLWCCILPKVAPYLVNRTEIDILFESLYDERGNVREATSEAISILTRTSETSRSLMLPTLLRHLDNPSAASIPSITQAISLSGLTFVSNGKEDELLYLVLSGKDMHIHAIEAATQVLSKGSSFEHQKLVKANPDVLTVALKLHNRRTRRQHSLRLLHSIVTHLSYLLLLDEELAREMFSLFDDPDPGLQNALYQTWTSDPRVSESNTLPELLPLLFDDERLRNSSVKALLRELAPAMVPRLTSRRRLDILVRALMINDVNVVQSFLQETCTVIENSNENEKGWFAAEPSFVSAIGEHLKGHDPTMRRHSSIIIQLLSVGSTSRSGRIMNEGIGQYLSWVAVNGETGAQQSSLHALHSLFMAAPDHAERLVSDSLPALCDILEQEDLPSKVYTRALRLLNEIVKQSPHSAVIESGIIVYLVRWSSPRYSVTDVECKKYVFLVCQLIAQQSDAGRQALINTGILPELSNLASSRVAIEVISACKILKALAHTGTFRQDIKTARLKDSMKNITSLFSKSNLKNKEEKHLAQIAAKEALEAMKASKLHNTESLLLPHPPQRSPNQTRSGHLHPKQLSRQNSARRSASEPYAISSFGTPTSEGQTREARQSTTSHLRHARSLSEPNRSAIVRPQFARLSAVQEDLDMQEFLYHTSIGEGNHAEPSLSNVRLDDLRQSPRNQSPAPIRTTSSPVVAERASEDEDHLADISSSMVPRTAPPSYRPLASVSGSVRRPMNRGRVQDLLLTTAEELDFNPEETGTNTWRATPRRSYKSRKASSE